MKTAKVMALVLIFVSLSYAAEIRQKKVFTATVNEEGVQVVELVGGEYYFDPDYIIVKANVPVEFRVKKAGGIVPHDIVIDASEADVKIKEDLGKEQKKLRFTLKRAGKYQFYCTKKLLFFKSHKERGMEGIIEAVE